MNSIRIPPSKSLTHRYFILATLAEGLSVIKNPLFSDDTYHTLQGLKNLGVRVKVEKNQVKIIGFGRNIKSHGLPIFLGDSGTSARLLVGLAALSPTPVIIDGSTRLKQRPFADLFHALTSQRVHILYREKKGQLPIEIWSDSLKGGTISISGSVSSQFISSLLMISPFARKNTRIKITDDLKSKPYVDLTIDAMKKFGVSVKNNAYKSFVIQSSQKYKGISLSVEGDYSSASYFIALSFLSGREIVIRNLNSDSKQADHTILDAIKKLGGRAHFSKGNLTIKRSGVIKSGVIDISDCPDIALTLGVIGLFTENHLILTGTKRLKDKESDRGEVLVQNLKKLGARVKKDEDTITIWKSKLHGGEIDTYNDHRVAMSFGILAKIIPGIKIKNPEVVSKSYPDFFRDLQSVSI
ncbi:3-phosphoshikimate 1-carboxyvinyltransferase [Candidatus Roizmanbacteria bacterium RIFCSPHIGHO2_01_FULL_39_8]|uniref:3-phosphoshikimate 1-carboxyvinyltransferase n=1 Tax=Candidatus Roizmanbacteria bacterium RIFCSPHIGHO2_01_FULL_39_8 TaxID=1802033 RepID=A0A1F7GJH4_9BACT|nr:MAG: 3-phosphoshikimate 1-carboxyvinyltransferase [Candidatus Roizmanbacteria bacterium RIFCSPHIGHO2_01_FULL_39_8]